MTTAHALAARRITYQFETLWDFDYEPTHGDLQALYETAKKNQWNGSTAIERYVKKLHKIYPVDPLLSWRICSTTCSRTKAAT